MIYAVIGLLGLVIIILTGVYLVGESKGSQGEQIDRLKTRLEDQVKIREQENEYRDKVDSIDRNNDYTSALDWLQDSSSHNRASNDRPSPMA